MKVICVLIFSLLVPVVMSQPASRASLSADTVMRKVAAKLASLKRLGYKYRFEFSYPSQNRTVVHVSQAFLDLAPSDRNFRFRFSEENRLSVYNGSESFVADNKSGKLWVENNPSFNRVGFILLQNSPLALKNALPKLIENKGVEKRASITKISGREYYLIEFSLPKAELTATGEVVEIRFDQTSIYRITVDKNTYLPTEVVQTNDKNDEVLKTSFADLTEKPLEPEALSWYYSTYQNEYRLEKKEPLTLITAGRNSPDFDLAQFGSLSRVSLDSYKGKLVLLEFWIAHCGFCIAAVPKLNAIAAKFSDKGLHVVSINMYDPATTIGRFKNNNKPEYMILTGGESIASAYGVEEYPAIVLVDKAGKVVYSSSGLHLAELEAAIMANIQQ